VTSPDGVPYLVPEIMLLFKARHDRPKDQADFAGALPSLNRTCRTWLAAALARVHPGHSCGTRLRRAPRLAGSRCGGGRDGPPAVDQVAAQYPQYPVGAEQPFGAVLQADDPD
jgi:hypothetical protein